jgi:tight adherence protein C
MLPSVMVAFSIGLAVWAIISINAEAIAGSTRPDEFFTDNPIFKIFLPYIQAIGRRVEPVRMFDGLRETIHKKLLAAGKRDAITPDEFIGTMILGMLMSILIGVYFCWGFELGFQFAPPFAAIGAFLPWFGLSSMMKRRQHKIRRQLPYALDLLTLAVEAGLDFTAALMKIGDKLKGTPLAQEIKRLSRDIQMGKTRAEALKDMSSRVQIDEMRSVVSSLCQAEELGSPLGGVLRIQAEEIRRKRFQAAEKAALEAPVKLLFPLVVFIFPLVFIVVFGPIIIKFVVERPL